MGKALYRKYRPKKLAEVVGQKHITDTLNSAIKSSKISHAYLLTGTRGVGKTSLARILAHEINGFAYDEMSAHLDIIEIDAASNRRIDEIRDLRDKVHILPTIGKYKVYIIDEVHMLTREAFNALLKTLEEPPEHVIFILATTEVHKLPETIVSRTQHFSFKPIDTDVIVKHLQTITKAEKLAVDDAALRLIAKHGDGSFRDSISLLDQARSLSDAVKETHVQQLLGIAPDSALNSIIEALASNDPQSLFDLLSNLRAQGLQSAALAKQLSGHLRSLIISDPAWQQSEVLHLLEALLGVQGSTQPDRLLEIILLEYIFNNRPQPTAAPLTERPTPQEAKAPLTETAPKEPVSPPPKKADPIPKQSAATKAKPATSTPAGEITPFDETAWPLVVAEVKKSNNTLYGILRMAKPSITGDTLTLSFAFAFHQKQVNEAKNRQIIEDIIKRQTGNTLAIACIVNKEVGAPDEKTDKSDHLDTVSNIFGGGEVLESD